MVDYPAMVVMPRKDCTSRLLQSILPHPKALGIVVVVEWVILGSLGMAGIKVIVDIDVELST